MRVDKTVGSRASTFSSTTDDLLFLDLQTYSSVAGYNRICMYNTEFNLTQIFRIK
jgi:hypothetical protein